MKEKKKKTNKSLCNCRDDNICPLKNKCFTKNVIYKAMVNTKTEIKQYVGAVGDLSKQGGMALKETLKYIKKT